jgi:hypothetical protein
MGPDSFATDRPLHPLVPPQPPAQLSQEPTGSSRSAATKSHASRSITRGPFCGRYNGATSMRARATRAGQPPWPPVEHLSRPYDRAHDVRRRLADGVPGANRAVPPPSPPGIGPPGETRKQGRRARRRDVEQLRSRAQPKVQSTMTFLRAVSSTASSWSSSRSTNSFDTPRRWTGTVSVRRATPAPVKATVTPRPSSAAFARRTRPSSTNLATRRVNPEREMRVRAASSVIRSSPSAAAS